MRKARRTPSLRFLPGKANAQITTAAVSYLGPSVVLPTNQLFETMNMVTAMVRVH